jgi:hypothetical protein
MVLRTNWIASQTYSFDKNNISSSHLIIDHYSDLLLGDINLNDSIRDCTWIKATCMLVTPTLFLSGNATLTGSEWAIGTHGQETLRSINRNGSVSLSSVVPIPSSIFFFASGLIGIATRPFFQRTTKSESN